MSDNQTLDLKRAFWVFCKYGGNLGSPTCLDGQVSKTIFGQVQSATSPLDVTEPLTPHPHPPLHCTFVKLPIENMARSTERPLLTIKICLLFLKTTYKSWNVK